MDSLPNDIINELFHNLHLKYQIRLIQTNKYFNKIPITDFINIGNRYSKEIYDNILINYPHITQLWANWKNIKSIGQFTNLKELKYHNFYTQHQSHIDYHFLAKT